MDEVDNSMFHIPTSSLVSKVSADYTKSTPAPNATVAPSNTKTIENAAVSPASIDLSPKKPQSANIQTTMQSEKLDYAMIYEELNSASEEVIECRTNRLSSVF